ncbi:hypothetical protein ACFCV3_10975 [Kribbella sp. NPDC056345]|uniref:hypothetical protein n=1 Tax=Kribbella sp. NPDC056345 TaxID=3345789 RepID=UPI0035DB514F
MTLLSRTLGAFAGAALLVVGGATAASASPTAVAEEPPYSEVKCLNSEYASTCFQWVGDDQWIIDREANGWAAVVHVQTNYGKNVECKAMPAAEGWALCLFDHEEGKCVRFRLYELKDDVKRKYTAWSPWYGTEYGSLC